MRKALNIGVYVTLDFLLTFLVWLLFFLIRRTIFEGSENEALDDKFYSQLPKALLTSSYWILLYFVWGLYKDPYRKSRLNEFLGILKVTILGVLIVFFVAFLDDSPPANMYRIYLLYFGLQFGVMAGIHFLVSTIFHSRIRRGTFAFNTLIVGSGNRAKQLVATLAKRKRKLGYNIIGFVNTGSEQANDGPLKHLGEWSQIKGIIKENNIEEIILCPENETATTLNSYIEEIASMRGLHLKIVPELLDKVSGSIKKEGLFGSPLVEIRFNVLSQTEKIVKRVFDILFSGSVLLMLSPILGVIALLIKRNSRGPIFFLQERIGHYGVPFYIIKFRTMVVDAEKNGPALSSDNDPRITSIGRFLRKTRIDEIPQFWNVIRGDMSLIGPRPERQFFIDQIVKKAPQYLYLQKVKPGITSWGMVRFGYAENVDQMIERMKFDLLYLENISLRMDLKIMIYTVVVMVEGRGK